MKVMEMKFFKKKLIYGVLIFGLSYIGSNVFLNQVNSKLKVIEAMEMAPPAYYYDKFFKNGDAVVDKTYDYFCQLFEIYTSFDYMRKNDAKYSVSEGDSSAFIAGSTPTMLSTDYLIEDEYMEKITGMVSNYNVLCQAFMDNKTIKGIMEKFAADNNEGNRKAYLKGVIDKDELGNYFQNDREASSLVAAINKGGDFCALKNIQDKFTKDELKDVLTATASLDVARSKMIKAENLATSGFDGDVGERLTATWAYVAKFFSDFDPAPIIAEAEKIKEAFDYVSAIADWVDETAVKDAVNAEVPDDWSGFAGYNDADLFDFRGKGKLETRILNTLKAIRKPLKDAIDNAYQKLKEKADETAFNAKVTVGYNTETGVLQYVNTLDEDADIGADYHKAFVRRYFGTKESNSFSQLYLFTEGIVNKFLAKLRGAIVDKMVKIMNAVDQNAVEVAAAEVKGLEMSALTLTTAKDNVFGKIQGIRKQLELLKQLFQPDDWIRFTNPKVSGGEFKAFDGVFLVSSKYIDDLELLDVYDGFTTQVSNLDAADAIDVGGDLDNDFIKKFTDEGTDGSLKKTFDVAVSAEAKALLQLTVKISSYVSKLYGSGGLSSPDITNMLYNAYEKIKYFNGITDKFQNFAIEDVLKAVADDYKTKAAAASKSKAAPIAPLLAIKDAYNTISALTSTLNFAAGNIKGVKSGEDKGAILGKIDHTPITTNNLLSFYKSKLKDVLVDQLNAFIKNVPGLTLNPINTKYMADPAYDSRLIDASTTEIDSLLTSAKKYKKSGKGAAGGTDTKKKKRATDSTKVPKGGH